MKFSIMREEFISVLSEYINILKENPIKPIVSGLKICAKGKKVIFIGTNLEIEHVKKIKADIEEEGEVVIKPFLLLEYIKLLEEEKLEFSSENGFIIVHRAEFSILEGENYPTIPELKSNVLLKIVGNHFVQLLDKAKFAASQSTDNIQINCVRAVFKKDELNLVSTDSYRLLFLKERVECEESREISIPMESVNTLCKLLKDCYEEINIGYNGEKLIITWKNSYFSSKTIGLQYPDFKTILRISAFEKRMEFNRDELRSAIKRVITVAKTSLDAKFGAIFTFAGKMMLINAVSGKAKINQKVNMLKDGEDFKASLNCKFLSEYIDNISGNVIISGNNASSMFEIKEAGNDDYIYILMPLALRD
ncbi:DNA polymerase III subunit beta [Fusobacterium necrogenes]|uniref:DNA polymerase III subunit beta n=1 Tax=Fusobacterium necrogenes TaxID=858 RepID=UPI00255C998A|nr:DNA polymerase III subunit beta [Fusobacterium necrogenes]